MKSYINILATADTSTIVTKTMAGKEYTVVPCIALVEGVLQGANSPSPELALASEFGKMVDGWNGRPLVLNHPKVNGQFVSANSPSVLEGWQMGYIFNARVEDKKLKVDAWIDNARVAELGGEFVTIKEAIESGELIEVSTGLYTELVKMHGVYQGEKYEAVWENIVPDHLAILSFGTIGACSIEDGCGIPRLNSQQQLAAIGKSHPEMRIHMSGMKQTNNKDDKNVKVETPCACGGKSETTTETPEPTTNARTVDPATHDALALFETKFDEISKLNVNAYPAGMPDKNVRMLLAAALKNSEFVKSEGGLWQLHMFTADTVIYETWSVVKTMSIGYNIGDDMKVEFIGEPQEVAILSQIVPVTNSDAKPGDAGVKGNAAVTTKETKMTDVKETTAGKDTGVQANQTATPTGDQPGAAPGDAGSQAAPAITVETEEAKGQGAKPKVLSTQEYIDNAPDEIKAVLNSALEQRNQNRQNLMSAIKANKTNVFSDDDLKAMDDGMLKKLAALAGQTVDYSGNAPSPIKPQTADNDVPAAPKVFGKDKKSA